MQMQILIHYVKLIKTFIFIQKLLELGEKKEFGKKGFKGVYSGEDLTDAEK